MNKTVTNRQIFFILFLTLTSITLATIPKVTAEYAGVGGWLTIIITALMFGVFIIVISSLNNAHKGKVLFEYSQEIVGKFLTYIISVIYVLFFMASTVYLIFALSTIIKANFLLKTPMFATYLLTTAICGYGAYKGIRNVGRLLELYGTLFLVSVVLVHTLMLFQGDIIRIRPLFVPSELMQYIKAVKPTILPFLGIEVMTVIPYTKQNGKKATTVSFLSILAIGLIYILAVESSIMMIGINEIVFYKDPTVTAIRLVELPKIEFLRRIDILYLLIGFMGAIAGIMMTYTATVEYSVKMFAKVNRTMMVAIIGTILFFFGLMAFAMKDFPKMFEKNIVYVGLVTSGLIPFIILIISKVRKKCEKSDFEI